MGSAQIVHHGGVVTANLAPDFEHGDAQGIELAGDLDTDCDEVGVV
jgi:hypothetical protein